MSKKIEFAHMLRGVAALSVLVAHYCSTFFVHHEGLAGLLQVPPLAELPAPTGVVSLIGGYGTVLGQFGVGVFFIISGFVIPFSIRSGSRMSFMTRRALRIFPVYIAGFGAVIASIWVLTRYAGSDFGYTTPHILSHFGILTRGVLGYGRIDGISWTLEVELVFYIVMAAVGARVFARGAWGLVGAAIAVAALSIASTLALHHGLYNVVGNTGFQLWASILLILGLAYHALFTRQISSSSFLGVHAAVVTLSIAVWLCSDRTVYTWEWMAGYLVAMAVFAAGFLLHDRIRLIPGFNHLANISYPLYVVHALLGYAVMYWAIDNGLSAEAAILLAIGAAYILSVGLHLGVEKRFMRSTTGPVGPHVSRSIEDRLPASASTAP
ncbi:acyltransferase [Chelativorans sp.]|uniref:acyltransferase family protein n=1 Tax=Chelativorans sp. TaxID=2203393 RepID=UPI002811AC62|nr:acyltransferase [Chelativorans sp.]